MKMTKILSLLSCLILLVGLMAGCGGNPTSSSAPAGDSSSEASSMVEDSSSSSEVVVNELKTAFFDAHIVSAELVDEYEGKAPTEGGVFLKVEISVTNTMDQTITMFDTDFQAKYGDAGALPMEAFNDEMAPIEYDLEPGEEATYTYVYEIASGSEDVSILFEEAFDNGKTGETYTFPLDLG